MMGEGRGGAPALPGPVQATAVPRRVSALRRFRPERSRSPARHMA